MSEIDSFSGYNLFCYSEPFVMELLYHLAFSVFWQSLLILGVGRLITLMYVHVSLH